MMGTKKKQTLRTELKPQWEDKQPLTHMDRGPQGLLLPELQGNTGENHQEQLRGDTGRTRSKSQEKHKETTLPK